MISFLFFLLLLVVLFILSQPITVLLHELGHAVPVLLITRKPVDIFIGSYGNEEGCFRIKLGAIAVWLGHNPLKWVRRGGLCIPARAGMSTTHQLIYTLSGPFASAIIACVCLYLTFAIDLQGFLKLALIVFLFSALFDLIRNLYPDIYPAVLDDGTLVYNDGYHLRRLFLFRKHGAAYEEAFQLYEAKQFEEAALQMEYLLSLGMNEKPVYQRLIDSLIQLHRLEDALFYHQQMADRLPVSTEDLCDLASIHHFLGQQEECLLALDRVLAVEPENPVALNDKARFLGEWGVMSDE
jgi:hypothetical protein